MGVVRTISTRLAVEGEAAYKQSIAACNSELGVLKSNLALVESEFRGNANSMEALEAKGSALASVYDKQKEKVAALEAALANAKRAQEEYEARVTTAREKISQYETALEELKNSTGDTSEEQAALTAELDKWSAELQEAEAYQAAAERGVNNWQKQLNNAKTELNNLDAAIGENNKYLDEAAESADGCATSIDEYGKKNKDAKQSVSELGAALAAAGVAKLIKEIAEAFKECADASIEFESAITGVYKTVDGTAAELEAISNGIKKMATEIPASTTEIAAVAEAAGQLGIATADVLSFTEVMINLGVSTNMSAEEAATALARFSNITGTAAEDYERLGSTIVALGNNFATTEGEITQMATRLASAGTLAGLTETEILALSAAMSSVGIQADAGGTAMTQTFSAIEKAVANGGESLDQFAQIAGMSSDDFATKWKTAPMEAIQAFISGLGGLEAKGENATLVLDDMGLSGIRQANMLKSLALASDELSSAVDMSSEAWRGNTALANEAALRYETTESRLQMASNAANNLKIAIGDALSPALGELADLGTVAFQWAADFIEDHPGVVSAITGIITALGILLAAFAAFSVIKTLIPLIKAFNLALAANPAILIATALIGLAVAVGTFVASLDDADAQTQAFNESLKESNEAYKELAANMEAEQKSTQGLKSALNDLLEVENKSAAQKEAILGLVDELNESVPGLGLAYDAATDSINMTSDSLENLVEKAAEQEEYEAQVARLTELYGEQAEANARLTEAQDALTEAQETGAGGTRTLQNNIDDLTEAEAALAAEIAELEEASREYGEQQAAVAAQTAEMEGRVNSLVTQITELQAAYDEAYLAAYESISEQLGLFTELDGTAKTSIGNLIETLDGQIDYMNTYAENIKKAMELGVDEGLVQKLSDGSEESAQILAAIVEGGEEDIALLNEKLAQVEEGKEDFSETVAEMETEFNEKMGELVADLDAAIAEMDVADDAYIIGTDNIQGLIDGAASKKSALVSTYTDMANAALAAYKNVMAQMSPSRKMFEAGSFDFEGLIEGARSKEAELKETYGSMARAALDAVEKSKPPTFDEPSQTAQQDKQTAAIVKALSADKEKGGDTYVNITSPEPMDERTAAREFKKAQRDLSLEVS